jgi:hypothetical protein
LTKWIWEINNLDPCKDICEDKIAYICYKHALQYTNMLQGYTVIYIYIYIYMLPTWYMFQGKIRKAWYKNFNMPCYGVRSYQCWAILSFSKLASEGQVSVPLIEKSKWPIQTPDRRFWKIILQVLTLNQGSKSVLKLGQRTYPKPPILANHSMKSFSSLKIFKKPKIGGLLYSEILQKTQHQRVYDPTLGRYTILSY